MKRCIDCGTKITSMAKRCRSCNGKALRTRTQNYCLECGVEISDCAKRCTKCNTTLQASDPEFQRKRLEGYRASLLAEDPEIRRERLAKANKACWDKPDARQKLSDRTKRCWSDPEWKRKTGSAIRSAWERGAYAKRYKISKLEQLFAAALSDVGVPYLQQYLPVGISRPADFYLLGTGLIIEIDGSCFHSREQDIASDNEKDRMYNAVGYAVMRIPEDVIYEQGVVNVIKDYVLPEFVPHG